MNVAARRTRHFKLGDTYEVTVDASSAHALKNALRVAAWKLSLSAPAHVEEVTVLRELLKTLEETT